MSVNPPSSAGAAEEAPALPEVRRLDVGAPLRWLAAGWGDLRRAPLVSLGYGAFFVAAGYLLSYLAWSGGNYVLLFSLLTGFMLVGPVLAFGLYDISRRLERGQRPALRHCWSAMRESLAGELVFALLLTVIVLVWIRAAAMVHVFFPATATPGLSELAGFFVVGTLVGAGFAALVFSVSVFALPLMMDRQADIFTAVITSVRAVLENKLVMLFWGGLIVAAVAIGFATALLGLAITLPLIGYATWHGYKETVLPPA